jgi:hypothetical protein
MTRDRVLLTAEEAIARELAHETRYAEGELSALRADPVGEPPASSDAIGLEEAWRAVEAAGRGVWRVLSVERLADGWQAVALDARGEVLVTVGRAPGLALSRLARAVRQST